MGLRDKFEALPSSLRGGQPHLSWVIDQGNGKRRERALMMLICCLRYRAHAHTHTHTHTNTTYLLSAKCRRSALDYWISCMKLRRLKTRQLFLLPSHTASNGWQLFDSICLWENTTLCFCFQFLSCLRLTRLCGHRSQARIKTSVLCMFGEFCKKWLNTHNARFENL